MSEIVSTYKGTSYVLKLEDNGLLFTKRSKQQLVFSEKFYHFETISSKMEYNRKSYRFILPYLFSILGLAILLFVFHIFYPISVSPGEDDPQMMTFTSIFALCIAIFIFYAVGKQEFILQAEADTIKIPVTKNREEMAEFIKLIFSSREAYLKKYLSDNPEKWGSFQRKNYAILLHSLRVLNSEELHRVINKNEYNIL